VQQAFPSSCFMVSPTTCGRGTTSRRHSPGRGTGCLSRTSVGTARHAFVTQPLPGWPSKRQSARMSSISPTRSASRGLPWPATTGVDAPRASRLHRVRAAVIIGGYLIQDTITPARPAAPETEQALWYQWYFNTERGRAGLGANRRSLCRLLWHSWSPTWVFTDETFNRTAGSFDNPDFVEIVIHSYRHRNLNAAGEPRFAALERRLAERPKIEVPSILLHGADDGIGRPPADSPAERASFTSLVARRVIAGAGHFLPREKPEAVSSAMLELLAATH
jgi:pimeloyl-ACP methyl ester carboxylesterase